MTIRFLYTAVMLIMAVIVLGFEGCAAPITSTPSPSSVKADPSATPTLPIAPTATSVPSEVAPLATATPEPRATAPVDISTPSVPPSAGSGAPSQADKLLEAAKRDAASRAGAPVSDVVVVRAEVVEWRDSSLGCPEPGKAYLQVITPGYSFTLRVGDDSYEYHTDRGDRVVLCRSPY